ncbi:MAG: hypothetical protein WCI18_09975 [Pseudomonadota bacterium]
MKNISYILLFLAGCGLDNCLYTTECRSVKPALETCPTLKAKQVKRFTEEAVNALDKEDYSTAIELLDCLIIQDGTNFRNFARRGFAYAGRTARYAPITLLANVSKPTFLDSLKTELTSLAPSSLEESSTLFQVGQDLGQASSDLITALSLMPDPGSYKSIRWLALLYSGIGSAYTLNSHRLFASSHVLDPDLILLIESGRGQTVSDTLAASQALATTYATDPDSVTAGLSVAVGAILLGINYPTYLVSVGVSGVNQGLVDFLQL